MSMEQIPIAPHSPLANRSIVEASVRRRLGVIVFGIQWEDSRMELNPQPDTAILLCDKRVALRRPESLRRVDLDDAEGVR